MGKLVESLRAGERFQTLLGVTGSGKTFTMAHVVQTLQRPTLVISPNKTLAAQLVSEFRDFFPDNAVEYFVSYYDYFQPEAYVPAVDLYIEKDASVNEEIDRLRHRATQALLTRRDVLIVASVSCIYGLGSPEDYREHVLVLRKGENWPRRELVRQLVRLRVRAERPGAQERTLRGARLHGGPPGGERGGPSPLLRGTPFPRSAPWPPGAERRGHPWRRWPSSRPATSSRTRAGGSMRSKRSRGT
ncbi:excinuclease ABC, B subunit, partial [mine drainage metagenome]